MVIQWPCKGFSDGVMVKIHAYGGAGFASPERDGNA